MNRGGRQRSRGCRGDRNYVYVPKTTSSSSSSLGGAAPSHRSVGKYDGSFNECPSRRESEDELSDVARKDEGLNSMSSGPEQSGPLANVDAVTELFGFTEVSSRVDSLRIADGSPAATAGRNPDQSRSLSPGSNWDEHFPSLSAKSKIKDKHSGPKWHQKEHTVRASGGSDNNSEPPSRMVDLNVMRYEHASHEKTNSSTKLDESRVLQPGVGSVVGHDSDSGEKKDGSGNIVGGSPVVPFDICIVRTGIQLKTPLHIRNKEKRMEAEVLKEAQYAKELRPGMVHLSRYLSVADQVKVVKICRNLGKDAGGFYQPGYRDGAKLNLKMMCLGKNWDPQTTEYGDLRPTDGAKPPAIPNEFYELVRRAIQDSHSFLKKQYNRLHVEEILPTMTPDICIVNFYTSTGRLGLHQDKDESRESLREGLPVVSFSIGDSAEFVYSDQKDTYKVEKVVLQSGDVLIFGGESRHVFHGVTTITSETASKSLLEETNLRPGRLNLTFRKY